jgi:hypothetical protein
LPCRSEFVRIFARARKHTLAAAASRHKLAINVATSNPRLFLWTIHGH